MKLFLLSVLLIAFAKGEGDFDTSEFDPQDGSVMFERRFSPKFWGKQEVISEIDKNGKNSRIIGGQEVAPNSHIYMVRDPI